MEFQPYRTCEFDREQRAALALAGTVALPSPFPASARIFIGIMPRHVQAVERRFYLKIVETIGAKYKVTRLVDLAYLRAVRVRPESGRYHNLSDWTVLTIEDLHGNLDDAKEALNLAVAEEATTSYEVPLFPEVLEEAPDEPGQGEVEAPAQGAVVEPERQGIVYVPETAPVLVRTEYAVTAVEAAEAIDHIRSLKGNGCCCIKHPGDYDR